MKMPCMVTAVHEEHPWRIDRPIKEEVLTAIIKVVNRDKTASQRIVVTDLPGKHLSRDLGIDSLEMMELFMTIEEICAIQIQMSLKRQEKWQCIDRLLVELTPVEVFSLN